MICVLDSGWIGGRLVMSGSAHLGSPGMKAAVRNAVVRNREHLDY